MLEICWRVETTSLHHQHDELLGLGRGTIRGMTETVMIFTARLILRLDSNVSSTIVGVLVVSKLSVVVRHR